MKVLRRIVLPLLLITAAAMLLGGCSGDGDAKKDDTGKTSEANKEKVFTIGIVQIVEHPSLNEIREAFINGLAAQGYVDGEKIKIDYQNAQGDQVNLKTICQKFVSSKYDLIVPIATPSAQAAAGETKEIPILFTACTNPLGDGLVNDLQKPGKNITGTSDAVDVAQIMDLALKLTPDIKTIGTIYNSGETNASYVVKELLKYAEAQGMSVVEKTITNSSEVQQAAMSLVDKVDAIFIPIDNTVASAMPVVSQVANQAKIPVYVSADSLVADGGLATYGIDYTVLGEETAKMAVEIINGKNPGDIPVKTMKDLKIYINKTTAETIGVEIPQDIADQAEFFSLAAPEK